MSDVYIIRLIIVGETGVGKTSLLIRFNEDNFILDQKTTIGVDYKAKEVIIGDDTVKLQVSCSFCLVLFI
jgi:GTPase SAR1 family protein